MVAEKKKEVVCFRMCCDRADGFDGGFEKGIEGG